MKESLDANQYRDGEVAKELMKILTSFAMRPGMALLNLFQSEKKVVEVQRKEGERQRLQTQVVSGIQAGRSAPTESITLMALMVNQVLITKILLFECDDLKNEKRRSSFNTLFKQGITQHHQIVI